MCRTRVIVAPIDQSGGAGIDLIKRTHFICNADISRIEMRCKPRMHRSQILGDGPIRGNATQTRLPRMNVGVDETRHRNLATGIDHLGPFRGLEVFANCLNFIIVD